MAGGLSNVNDVEDLQRELDTAQQKLEALLSAQDRLVNDLASATNLTADKQKDLDDLKGRRAERGKKALKQKQVLKLEAERDQARAARTMIENETRQWKEDLSNAQERVKELMSALEDLRVLKQTLYDSAQDGAGDGQLPQMPGGPPISQESESNVVAPRVDGEGAGSSAEAEEPPIQDPIMPLISTGIEVVAAGAAEPSVAPQVSEDNVHSMAHANMVQQSNLKSPRRTVIDDDSPSEEGTAKRKVVEEQGDPVHDLKRLRRANVSDDGESSHSLLDSNANSGLNQGLNRDVTYVFPDAANVEFGAANVDFGAANVDFGAANVDFGTNDEMNRWLIEAMGNGLRPPPRGIMEYLSQVPMFSGGHTAGHEEMKLIGAGEGLGNVHTDDGPKNPKKKRSKGGKGKEKAVVDEEVDQDRGKSVWDQVDDREEVKPLEPIDDEDKEKEDEIREWVWDSIDHPDSMKSAPRGTYGYMQKHSRFVPEAAYTAPEIARKVFESEKDAFKCVAHTRSDKQTKAWDTESNFIGVPFEPFPTTVKKKIRSYLHPQKGRPMTLEMARQQDDVRQMIHSQNERRREWGQTLELSLGVTDSGPSNIDNLMAMSNAAGTSAPIERDEYGRDVRAMDCGCDTRRAIGWMALWKMGRLSSTTHPGKRMGGDDTFLSTLHRDMVLEALEGLGKVHVEDLYTHELEDDPDIPGKHRYRKKNPMERLCKQAYRVFDDMRMLASRGTPVPPGYEVLGAFLGLENVEVKGAEAKEGEMEPMCILDEQQKAYLAACAGSMQQSRGDDVSFRFRTRFLVNVAIRLNMIRSLLDIRPNFPISRHRTRTGNLPPRTAEGKIEGDETMAMRHAHGRGRSLLDCPDTDNLVEIQNAYLDFSVNHPRLGFPHSVDCLYWGRLCTGPRKVVVPLQERWSEPKKMFQNLLIWHWLLFHDDEDEIRRGDLLTREEATRLKVQYTIFYYRQDHPLIREELDLNTLWYASTAQRQRIYGPLLVFKHELTTNLPVSLDIREAQAVAWNIERFIEAMSVKRKERRESSEEVPDEAKDTHGEIVAVDNGGIAAKRE
ncbi:hypothetical protein VNI00_018129 [Paramarasmius palmivorus]|uniref:Uncharacterized protein n=1 Tax=Paramarasmius palmivorus TaxID=297713 RepID=A0AAW0B1K4_9AGAR